LIKPGDIIFKNSLTNHIAIENQMICINGLMKNTKIKHNDHTIPAQINFIPSFFVKENFVNNNPVIARKTSITIGIAGNE
jgi:hypothetical protein